MNVSTKRGLSFKKKLKIYTTVFLTMILCYVLKKATWIFRKKDKFRRILPIDLAFQTTERYPETTGTVELCEKSGPHTWHWKKKTFKSGPFNTFHHLQRYDYAEEKGCHPLPLRTVPSYIHWLTSSHPYTSFWSPTSLTGGISLTSTAIWNAKIPSCLWRRILPVGRLG